jgi:hypothetical protein
VWRSRLAAVLVTLRLHLVDGPERLLTREVEENDSTLDPRELLERFSSEGRVSLGDRESCSLASIVSVEVVHPESVEGPALAPGIRDEDVAAARKGNYQEH